jgi:serine acetyltransferase
MKGDIDSRKSPAKGSVNAAVVTNPFYQALVMARLNHICWKSTREAIEA